MPEGEADPPAHLVLDLLDLLKRLPRIRAFVVAVLEDDAERAARELGRCERVSAGHARSIRCRIVPGEGERRLDPGERSSPEQGERPADRASGLAITGIERWRHHLRRLDREA